MSGLDSLGVVVSRAPPGEVGRLELFIDRNPDAFGVVLDMLRAAPPPTLPPALSPPHERLPTLTPKPSNPGTSRFMLPPSISHEMAEVELHHYGIPTAGDSPFSPSTKPPPTCNAVALTTTSVVTLNDVTHRDEDQGFCGAHPRLHVRRAHRGVCCFVR